MECKRKPNKPSHHRRSNVRDALLIVSMVRGNEGLVGLVLSARHRELVASVTQGVGLQVGKAQVGTSENRDRKLYERERASEQHGRCSLTLILFRSRSALSLVRMAVRLARVSAELVDLSWSLTESLVARAAVRTSLSFSILPFTTVCT